MKFKEIKARLIWAAIGLGLAVALLALLETLWTPLANLCALFGSGCSQTANFTLFHFPLAVWGIIFYLVLALVYGMVRSGAFYLVMVGVGVEIALIEIMITRHLACLFCLANAVVMAALLLLFLRRRSYWQMIAICAIGLIASHIFIRDENPVPINRPAVNGDSIVAQVDGETITLRDLESGIATQLYKMRNDIYRLKIGHLEQLMLDILSKQQADRGSQAQPSTSDPATSENEPPDDQLKLQARRLLIDVLDSQPEIDQLLEKPPLPYTRIDAGNSPATGPVDAPLTVIEFSDYLCPACKRSHPITNQIKAIYQDKIHWVFKDFPLQIHPGADKLAEAARCANEQDKFWEFQDLLYAAENHPDDQQLAQFAGSLGLDVDRFNQCYSSGKYAQDVLKDKRDAQAAGVSVTPTYMINGRLNPGGMPLERFKNRIDEALGQDGP